MMLLLDKCGLKKYLFMDVFGRCVCRRTYRAGNDGRGCDKSSTAPPCTG